MVTKRNKEILVLNKDLGIVKRTHSRRQNAILKLEEYQEELLLDLLRKELQIEPGCLLTITVSHGLFMFPENDNITRKRSINQIKKTDILLFLGIRYDFASATYNARILLPTGQIAWVPISCALEISSLEEFESFTSLFSCILEKYEETEEYGKIVVYSSI